MLISNSLNKNKIENMAASNVLMRSDGFKKLLKGYSANKLKAEQNNHNKLHTSSGFRRYTKEYKLQMDTDGKDCSNELLPSNPNIGNHNYRTMTAAKQMGRRTNIVQSQPSGTLISSTTNFAFASGNGSVVTAQNDKKTVQFLKMEQQEEQCFKNVCKLLNVVL